MKQQHVADAQEQFGKIAKKPAQGGERMGVVSKDVKLKNSGVNTAASTERFSAPIKRTSNNGGGSSNKLKNHVAQSHSGRGRGKMSRGFTRGRSGIANAINSSINQGKARGNAKKQKWEVKQDGQTDLGKKIYSTSWLLERRGKQQVQDSVCDLPNFLYKDFLSPASQKRRYPFASGSSHLLTERQEAAQKKSTDAFGFAERSKNKETDYSISQPEQTILNSQNEARKTNHQKNVFTSERKGINEHDEQPGHLDNIFSQSITKPSNTCLITLHTPPKLNPENRLLKKDDFLYNKLVKNKASLHTSPASRHQFSESSPPDVHGQKIYMPRDYDFKHSNCNEASHTHQIVAHEFRPKSLSDTYPNKPHHSSQQKLPSLEPVRFISTSSLKESEKEQVAKMLHGKLQRYSVPTSKLSYASKSAAQLVKNELKILGYVEVPRPDLNDVTLTKEEIIRFSCQHEIRKLYRRAILKANQEITKLREYDITKKFKKIPKHNSS